MTTEQEKEFYAKLKGKVVGMTVMKRRLKEDGVEPVNVRNIRINGELRGCSGFARGKAGFVYFTTEPPCQNFGFNGGACAMYRTARDERDYTGGYNQWCSLDSLAACVARLADGGLGA